MLSSPHPLHSEASWVYLDMMSSAVESGVFFPDVC
jgi:hypothetical protein